MGAVYTKREIEKAAEDCGLQVYEQIGKEEMDREYFASYQLHNPGKGLAAPQGICYCLLVKGPVPPGDS